MALCLLLCLTRGRSQLILDDVAGDDDELSPAQPSPIQVCAKRGPHLWGPVARSRLPVGEEGLVILAVFPLIHVCDLPRHDE
jgi:hypothetical protein